jgi:lipopolysaccharide transport system ATP-binding protein
VHNSVIHTEGLGKSYTIRARAARYKTLREVIMGGMRRWSSGFRNSERKGNRETFWAVRDVSISVRQGEIVGVIGRNGAGKSTLLKLLSRITEPTAGYADLSGRVGSLLEVGTGFHPELTGRENIYLNGAILGMRRSEIQRKFDDIVAFAEVDKFIDTPVKHYSSGMYLRLAFAVAAHLEPEILLVDEVLAVGDAAFQKKCIGRMEGVAREGRTVLFVSHNMGAVREICQRAIWLDNGSVRQDGNVEDVVRAYSSVQVSNSFSHTNREFEFSLERVVLRNDGGEATMHFSPGESMSVDVEYQADRPIVQPYIWMSVQSLWGSCFAANMILDGRRPAVLEGRGRLTCTFRSLPLLPQDYTIVLAMRSGDGQAIVPPQEVASFVVSGDLREHGFWGDNLHVVAPRSVPVVIPYEWTLPDGTSSPVQIGFQEDIIGVKQL